jgi:hypothetical protein
VLGHHCEAQLTSSDGVGGSCGPRRGRFVTGWFPTACGPSCGTREGKGLRKATVACWVAHTTRSSCGTAEATLRSVMGDRRVALHVQRPGDHLGSPTRRGGSSRRKSSGRASGCTRRSHDLAQRLRSVISGPAGRGDDGQDGMWCETVSGAPPQATRRCVSPARNCLHGRETARWAACMPVLSCHSKDARCWHWGGPSHSFRG